MMPATNSSRSLWILLFSIVVLGLLFAGATKDVSSETASAADEVPAPVLYDIDNADGDGNYMIEWSAVLDADDYRLHENIDGSASWELVFTGTDTSFSRSNMPDGQYCYRVRAIQGETLSPWSEDKCTTVGEPPPEPTATDTPTITSTPTATATQEAPTVTATNTKTPAPTSSSTLVPSPTATRKPIVNLPIIVYQLPPTATPTATMTPSPTNTPVPTNTPEPTKRPTNTPEPTKRPTNTPEPTSEPPPTGCNTCAYDAYNCDDFSRRRDAQACYEYCLEETGRDVHRLDNDNDGEACESLPWRTVIRWYIQIRQ